MKRLIIVIPGIMGTTIKYRKFYPLFPQFLRVFDNGEMLNKMLLGPERNPDVTFGDLLSISYKGLMKNLKKHENKDCTVVDFPYDWRQNNLDNAELLRDKIIANGHVDEVILVAHSMGGVISKLMLNKYSKEPAISKVKKLITMGTPWLGSPFAYKAFEYGFGIGFPTDNLPYILLPDDAKKISKTFPSVYQLLPHEEYYSHYDFLKRDNQPYDWKRAYREYYRSMLQEHRQDLDEKDVFGQFYMLMRQNLDIEHHEIIGYGVETICEVYDNLNREPFARFDNGDGTVPIHSQRSGTPYQYYVQGEHRELPKNNEVLQVLDAILSETPIPENIIRDYSQVEGRAFSGKIVRIACPVAVSVQNEEGEVVFGSTLVDESNIKEYLKQAKSVHSFGTTTYVFQSDEKSEEHHQLLVEAFAEGTTSISIDEYQEGRLNKSTLFKDFNVDLGKNAKVYLDGSLEGCRVVVEEAGKEPQILRPITVNRDVNRKPEVDLQYEVHANFKRQAAQGWIASGKVKLQVTVQAGDHDVSGVYYRVNKEEPVLVDLGKEQVLNKLRPGKNMLHLLYKDQFGTFYDGPQFPLWHVTDVEPNLALVFASGQYHIECRDPQQEIYDEIGTQFSAVNFEVEPQADRAMLEQSNMIKIPLEGESREVTVHFVDLFGREHDITLNVYEDVVVSILQGQSNQNDFMRLLEGVGLKNYKVKFIKKKSTRPANRIADENIRQAKTIFAFNNGEKRTVQINKDDMYWVRFVEGAEYIEFDKTLKYPFAFKILDTKRNIEVKDLELKAQARMRMRKNSDFKEELTLRYDEKAQLYQGDLDLGFLKMFDPKRIDEFKNLEFIIRLEGQILRERDITIK